MNSLVKQFLVLRKGIYLVQFWTDNPTESKASIQQIVDKYGLDWLVKHGVDRSRMTSEGFGMERPIDTNDTPVGRQNNRRVEFHIQDSSNSQ